MANGQNREARSGRKSPFSIPSFLWWALIVLAVYILPFLAVTIDEVLLKTYWFSKHLPDWVGDVLRAIYPFHKIFRS